MSDWSSTVAAPHFWTWRAGRPPSTSPSSSISPQVLCWPMLRPFGVVIGSSVSSRSDRGPYGRAISKLYAHKMVVCSPSSSAAALSAAAFSAATFSMAAFSAAALSAAAFSMAAFSVATLSALALSVAALSASALSAASSSVRREVCAPANDSIPPHEGARVDTRPVLMPKTWL